MLQASRIGRSRMVAVALLFSGSFFVSSSDALPERPLSFDISAGIPQLLALQGQVMALPHWQVGFGFGIVPGAASVTPNIKIPPQTISDPVLGSLTLTPQVTPVLNTLSPFIRFYPTERNFYIEFAYTMLRLNMDVTSTIQASAGGFNFSGAGVSGTISMLQAMPTLSLGHSFQSKLFFFNLSLGASFVASLSTSVSLNGDLPAVIGQTSSQSIVAQAQTSIDKAAQDAVASFRKQYFFIPSLTIAFGILI